MQLIGYIIAAAFVLVILRMAIGVMLILSCALFLWGAIYRPLETWGLVAAAIIWALFEAHPWALLIAVGAAVFVKVWNKRSDDKL